MSQDEKRANIEYIYMIAASQVSTKGFARGCYLEPRVIYQIDKRYEAIEKTQSQQTVYFNINEEAAAILIQANKAVTVIQKTPGGKWVCADIFGDEIVGGPIINPIKRGSSLKDDPSKEKSDGKKNE